MKAQQCVFCGVAIVRVENDPIYGTGWMAIEPGMPAMYHEDYYGERSKHFPGDYNRY